MLGLGSAIGLGATALGLMGSRRAGRDNPGDAAMQHMQRIPEYGERAYRPYITEGQKIDPQLQQRYQTYLGYEPQAEYQKMQQDPGAIIDALMQRYKPSEFYKFKQKEMLDAARNTAAAGGYAGTMSDQKEQMRLADALASSDMQQWLGNVLQQRMAGIAGNQMLSDKGLEGLEGISSRGFDASSRLADYLGGAQSQMGGAAFAGARDRGNRRTDFANALMGVGTGFLSGGMGLGGSGGGFGGPHSFGASMGRQRGIGNFF